MAKSNRRRTQAAKFLSSKELAIRGTNKKPITATEAAHSALPKTCFILPMKVLDPPEPIPQSRKR